MTLPFETKFGPYEIVAPLGAGGMGEVYRSRDTRLGREVAVKVLPPSARNDHGARARFRREALALSRLNHPNIEMVLDLGEQDGTDYLVLELVPGETLAARVARGRIPEREAAQIAAQVADALVEAHDRGVLHRDLKPGNIMITPAGRVKVLDFGLAKFAQVAEDTVSMDLMHAGSAVGTLAYMAPEQLLGESLDGRMDLYALGVVLYEMTTAQKPFRGAITTALANDILHGKVAPPRTHEPSVSALAEAVILRAIERESSRRYQTAGEMAGELRRLAEAHVNYSDGAGPAASAAAFEDVFEAVEVFVVHSEPVGRGGSQRCALSSSPRDSSYPRGRSECRHLHQHVPFLHRMPRYRIEPPASSRRGLEVFMFAIPNRFAVRLLFGLASLQVAPLEGVRAQEVFHTTFETGLPAEFSAPGSVIEPVQGWSGLGPPERQFSGSFLRYTSLPILTTTLTLQNLPVHDTLDLRFLLAVIDSWDGTEVLKISVDGTELFSHWFQLGSGDWTSYIAPPGALLSSGTDLGFSGGVHCSHDRAYDLGLDPLFLGIPHTSSSLVVTWTIDAVSGPAAEHWQGGDDESWAIDEVSVEVSNSSVSASLVPFADGIVLDGAWPNPSRSGPLAVHFALPSCSNATLDLFDVAGRLVDSRAVGFMCAGSHRIETSGVQPGVYFLRLSQGSDVKVKRAIVLE